jgi:hypothetical protein
MAKSPLETVPMPQRIRQLAKDARGYPVPWFVHWQDGKPLFPVVDPNKLRRALKFNLCWVCGDRLGRNVAFVLGPMCVANRITPEPPAHRDCALYALKVCPFLIQPRMKRVPLDRLPDEVHEAAGFPEPRNPGLCALWITRDYRPFAPTAGGEGMLIRIGDPVSPVQWWREGREATVEDACAGFAASCAVLHDRAAQEGDEAVADCAGMIERARQYLPQAVAS